MIARITRHTPGIPAYWLPMLTQKIATIQQLQADAGTEAASFGLISDIHWIDNAHHSAALMEAVLTECEIPYFFNAGDIVSGAGICPKEDLFEDLGNYRRSFGRIERKCLVAEGNHDSAYSTLEAPDYYAENLTKKELYEHYFRFETLYPDRVFGSDGTYYYADDNAHKIRYIVLNSHDVPSDETDDRHLPKYNKFRMTAVRQESLDWFSDVALDVPSTDWTVVLCTHENPLRGWEFYSGDMILGILNAFRNHTSFAGSTDIGVPEYETHIQVDFSNRGGDVAAWVCGHFHNSFCEVIEGINCISVHNDSLNQPEESPYPRIKGTDSEHAFDIFTIDKQKRKLFITRIGAGENREMDY